MSEIESLNGQTFTVELENAEGDSLALQPANAFSVTRSGDSFEIEIVNANMLIRSIGGLVLKRDVSWTATVSGGGNFELAIAGINNCRFSLRFSQDGGEELDLSQLQDQFDVSWTFNNPGAVETSGIEGTGISVTRKDTSRESDLSLTLNLRNDAEGVDVTGPPVSVPTCGRFLPETGTTTPIIQTRSPAQCIVVDELNHTEADENSSAGVPIARLQTSFANTCNKPVYCRWTWRTKGYFTAADMMANRNPETIDSYSQGRTIQSQQVTRFDFNLAVPDYGSNDNDFAAHFFQFHTLPDRALPSRYSQDFKCEWA